MPAQNVPHQDWQSLGASGLWGTYTAGGNAPVARNRMDQTRMGIGRVPSAEYPDGYLGNVSSRRGDRILDSVKARITQKNYQRGVHKGERIDPGDYLWPDSQRPERGIQNEAKGMKTSPVATLASVKQIVNDGKTGSPIAATLEISERRNAQLGRLSPSWR